MRDKFIWLLIRLIRVGKIFQLLWVEIKIRITNLVVTSLKQSVISSTVIWLLNLTHRRWAFASRKENKFVFVFSCDERTGVAGVKYGWLSCSMCYDFEGELWYPHQLAHLSDQLTTRWLTKATIDPSLTQGLPRLTGLTVHWRTNWSRPSSNRFAHDVKGNR